MKRRIWLADNSVSEEIFGSEARGFKMNKSANLIMALGLYLLCATSAPAQPPVDANQPQDAGVPKLGGVKKGEGY